MLSDSAMQSSPPPSLSSGSAHPKVRAFFESLSKLQTQRPFAVLFVALLSVIGAGAAASRLHLKTALSELLPANKESIVVAEQVKTRLSASSTLAIVAEGKNTAALKQFVDALAPALRALPADQVGTVDDGVRESRVFFEKNKALYAPLEDVQKAHDAIVSRYEKEVQRQAGLDLELDDESGETSGEPLNAQTIRAKLADKKKDALSSMRDRFPDGYYLEADGKLIAILVKTPVSPGDIEHSSALLNTVSGVINEVDPKRFDPDMQINFSGNLITGMEEYSQIKNDLSHVGMWGVGMILGVVFIFYLRLRTLAAMSVTVGIGTVWAFGFAYFAIGHLNSSTGFLVSIIVGNGINFGIIYMARYMEARRSEDLTGATLTAHLQTWLATLAAAGSATVAYGSLVVTDFRGFKHFGVIGGAGMILCWIATYAFLPAILAVMDRVAAIKPEHGLVAKLRGSYGRPFAWLTSRFPRFAAALALLCALGSGLLTVSYLSSDPMEYDMRNTRTEAKTGMTTARRLMGRLDNLIGRQGQDGLAIVVDKLEQVRPLREALEARWAKAPKDRKPFEKVTDIFDLLPKDQEKKIELITDAMSKLERAKKRGLISEADWLEIQRELPDLPISPIGIDDLPEQAVRMFIEKDGSRGKLIYIVPTMGRSVWDGRYLIEWADSFRETRLKDGSIVRGSGNAVIFADVIQAVVEDAPKAIFVSIAGTALIILFAFRGRRAALLVVATLALGLLGMMAALALYGLKITWNGLIPSMELVGLKLNFLNFVALPISVGVGADYAVNMMQRYQLSGRNDVKEVVATTGGAIILCSLTTVLGYFALTFSVNKAIVSFGYSAAAGEVSCLFAAVVALPAFLILMERRQND